MPLAFVSAILKLIVNATLDAIVCNEEFLFKLRLLLSRASLVDLTRVVIQSVQHLDLRLHIAADDPINLRSVQSNLRHLGALPEGCLCHNTTICANTSCWEHATLITVHVNAATTGFSDVVRDDLLKVRTRLLSSYNESAGFAALASSAPRPWSVFNPAAFSPLDPSSVIISGGGYPSTTAVIGAVSTRGIGGATSVGNAAVDIIAASSAFFLLVLVVFVSVFMRRRRQRST
jgi:hypothetical protein